MEIGLQWDADDRFLSGFSRSWFSSLLGSRDDLGGILIVPDGPIMFSFFSYYVLLTLRGCIYGTENKSSIFRPTLQLSPRLMNASRSGIGIYGCSFMGDLAMRSVKYEMFLA